MGAEDFAYYAQKVPAAIFRLGMRPAPDADFPNLHSSKVDFNDDALPIGMTLLARIAQTFLQEGSLGTGS
jgi:metal-dependent amidase/aminoacylase/carboxypeptidase family protein